MAKKTAKNPYKRIRIKRNGFPTLEIIPLDNLLPHEKINRDHAKQMAEDIRTRGVLRKPIWVARGHNVILNGHHRWAALKMLGTSHIPAWVLDYEDDSIVTISRWNPGPPISKKEVIRRALARRSFPPKTTRHKIMVKLPARPTPLSELKGQIK